MVVDISEDSTDSFPERDLDRNESRTYFCFSEIIVASLPQRKIVDFIVLCLAYRNELELQLVTLSMPSIPLTYIERNVIQVLTTLVFILMDIKEADLFAISEFSYFYT